MFAEGTEPPALPPYPYKLESTSQYLSGEPWVIGNNLLTYLASRPAFVKKANPLKFTVKCIAFDEDFSNCLIKISLYRMPVGYVVEFQRRSGDCVAFNNFYKNWLTGVEPKPLPSIIHQPLLQDDVAPLIDMLLTPMLQAEACGCLANLVCHGEIDVQVLLSEGNVRSILETMRACPEVVLSYPASKILDHR